MHYQLPGNSRIYITNCTNTNVQVPDRENQEECTQKMFLSGSEEDTVWFDDTCLIVLHVAVMCVNLSANRYAVVMMAN